MSRNSHGENQSKPSLNFRTSYYGFGSISFESKIMVSVLFCLSIVLFWIACGWRTTNLVLVADAITDPLVGYYSDELDQDGAEDILLCTLQLFRLP